MSTTSFKSISERCADHAEKLASVTAKTESAHKRLNEHSEILETLKELKGLPAMLESMKELYNKGLAHLENTLTIKMTSLENSMTLKMTSHENADAIRYKEIEIRQRKAGQRMGKMNSKMKKLEHAPANKAKKKAEANSKTLRATIISSSVTLIISVLVYLLLHLARTLN
jgi:hypothetical protein